MGLNLDAISILVLAIFLTALVLSQALTKDPAEADFRAKKMKICQKKSEIFLGSKRPQNEIRVPEKNLNLKFLGVKPHKISAIFDPI